MVIKENISLKELNTFKAGGQARYFCEVKNISELREVFDFVQSKNLPSFFLGWGSNVLISDEGFPGVVIKNSINDIEWREIGDGFVEVAVGSGFSWDELVKKSVEKNLYGLENLSGIPGTVGAAPVQNIGAYGLEIKDTLTSVEVFNIKKQKIEIIDSVDCGFDYRDSLFKKPEGKDFFITKVFLKLSKEGKPKISYKDLKNYFDAKPTPSLFEVREAVLKIRSEKFPDLSKLGTAGSFFKNPIVSQGKLRELKLKFPDMPSFLLGNGDFKLSAAWILDNVLNVKSKTKNQVGFFNKQPLVVFNLGGASSQEIKNVTDEIISETKKVLGIILEREVTLVGNFN